MTKKFLRPETTKYKRFKRKNKQKWRRPKGHDNKIRLNRAGRMKGVRIGFRSSREQRKKTSILIRNLKDLEKVKKGDSVIIGKIGKKKRLEIEEKIKDKGVKILNLKKLKIKKTEEKK
tara:strand:+ start:685 stop:1038 length:354 start_codon:yes stop_codon:yes gene_type:complete